MQNAEPRYTQEQWNRLLASTMEQIHSLARLKGGEYAGDLDKLANFRRNASALGLCPEQIWAVYAGKHWDAVQQYVKDTATGASRPRAESISGRLDDLIVYCVLLKAMVEERKAEAPKRPAPPLPPPPPLPPAPCPSADGEHRWAQSDRYTDTCLYCGALRAHQKRRS